MAKLKTITTKTHERKVYSVTELNRHAKRVLETDLMQVWLDAEMSNVTIANSGHWYFTLKDNRSQISSAMFKGSNRLSQVKPMDGIKVLVRGKVSLYEPRGSYQLIVDQMTLAGAGDLLAKFEELKQKLNQEGLFDPQLKQMITPIYQTIGIISSPTGAAVHDVLSVIQRRYPLQQVILYPSLVQGEKAVASLRKQLAIANQRQEVDVLLLVRGGGAIEDLWCFNDEGLARDIVNSSIPIVCGVGHEVDFTIADFVADLRAATPTAAAEKITPDINQIERDLLGYKAWFKKWMSDLLQRHTQSLDWYVRQLQKPDQIINRRMQELIISRGRLRAALQNTIQQQTNQLHTKRLQLAALDPRRQIQQTQSRNQQLQQKLQNLMLQKMRDSETEFNKAIIKLDNLSPLKVLGRGYSVTETEDNKIIEDAEQVTVGDQITSRLRHGRLVSTITEISKDS